MKHRLLGFFSGFPGHHFPPEIANRLKQDIEKRNNLVFVSAWPDEHARNDDDSDGMHNMFVECGMAFERHCVIDGRTDADYARKLIRDASCVFLMGGHPGLQAQLIHKLGLEDAISETGAAVLGVSAGAINMAVRSLDTKESLTPYDGLGLADITVKPHFSPENGEVLSKLIRVSAELPVCALEDDSAIFVSGGCVSHTGKVHMVNKGLLSPFADEMLML